MPRRILVIGASIVGNTAAWWVGRHGFDVTVVEKAPTFRDGGQNIDVRGAAREILRRMGPEQAVTDGGTGERGTAWVDEDGAVIAQFGADEGGPIAELEILRGDLSRLIYGPARARTTFRFGDRVASVGQDGGRLAVTFDSDRTEALLATGAAGEQR